jgi:hypothetical protein
MDPTTEQSRLWELLRHVLHAISRKDIVIVIDAVDCLSEKSRAYPNGTPRVSDQRSFCSNSRSFGMNFKNMEIKQDQSLGYCLPAFPFKISTQRWWMFLPLTKTPSAGVSKLTPFPPPLTCPSRFCLGSNLFRSVCLNTLYFDELHLRRDGVTEGQDDTNQWIWLHPQYEKWRDSDSCVLWIQGKPGSGKSPVAVQ